VFVQVYHMRAHCIRHTSAYVSIRQHTSAYVSIRQHTSAYVSIRQHTSAYVSIRQLAFVQVHHMRAHLREQVATKYVSIRQESNSTRPHPSSYVSIRATTSAFVQVHHMRAHLREQAAYVSVC
jgi:predicted metal-dependent hydrolase